MPRCAPAKAAPTPTSPTGSAARRVRAATSCRAVADAEAARHRGALQRRRSRPHHPQQGRRRAHPASRGRCPGGRLMYVRPAVVRAPRARSEQLLQRLRGACWSRSRRCSRAIGYQRARGPGRGRRARRSRDAVRLQDVRPVRAELDRHVLPDELPRRTSATVPAAACARTATARSSRRCAASGCEAFAGCRADRGRPRPGSASCRRRSTGAFEGRSAWLKVVRDKTDPPQPEGQEMIFEDEPVPGYPLPILPGHVSPGRLERVLRAGAFAVTTELAPPDSADPDDVYKRARVFDGYVDAINATDGSGANCHMSSLAVCALLTRVGYAPVMQISCRDKNRIAIQGDILGGAAMGVCNMLCLSGDGVQAGDHPQAKPVFDLDCCRCWRSGARCATSTLPERPQAQLRAAGLLRRRREPDGAAASTARSGSARRSPPAPSSSRRSTATTSTGCAPSCAPSRTSGSSTRCSC